jgi:hypothetical protein
MSESITREEKYLAALASGTAIDLEPITRRELFLAKACGMGVKTPTPITREEILLDKIASGGGTGAGLEALIDGSVEGILTTGATKTRDYAFGYCSELKAIEFLSHVTIDGMSPLSYCKSLRAVILRSKTICPLSAFPGFSFSGSYHYHGTKDATYNPDGLKDGYIYVPHQLLPTYVADTNWGQLESQFRALEDYTVDGTITGEFNWRLIGL